MTTEEALLAAVWANPHDDLPRLVYADWLDETGDPAKAARAEFIRVQCELARVGWWDDRTVPLCETEQRLLTDWRREWIPRQKLKHAGIGFHRGFFCPSYDGDLRTFRSEIPLARAVAPFYDLSLRGPDGFEAFVTLPVAMGLRTLELSDQFVGWGKRLVGTPVVRNLSRLRVADPHIPSDDFDRFCRAAHLAHLSEVVLSNFETTAEVIAKILTAPFAPQLRVLALGADRGFDSGGFAGLLSADSLNRVECLRVRVDDADYVWEGFMASLSQLPAGRGLLCLHINGGVITEGGCVALLDWQGAATLRELALAPMRSVPALSLEHLRVETLITLLESDRLPRLAKLTAQPINYHRRVGEDPGGRLAKLRQLAHDRGVKLELW